MIGYRIGATLLLACTVSLAGATDTFTHRETGNVVEFSFPDDSKPSADTGSLVREVVVTSIGLNPDKALENVFSQAIEQTVGVLVDAESLVKNDQLIATRIYRG